MAAKAFAKYNKLLKLINFTSNLYFLHFIVTKSICSLEAVEVVASVASTTKKVIDIVTGRILDPSLFSCLIYLSDKRVTRVKESRLNDKIQN
jgi:hypothetical protein